MKQMKKFLATVCALAMVVTGIVVAEPVKAETASSVEIVGAFSGNTGIESLTGDFDVTYTFNNASTGTLNHENFIVEIRTEDGAGCFDLRADRYGWGWGTCDETIGANGANIQWAEPGEEYYYNWETWTTDMKDADCEVNIQRTGDVITATFTMTAASGKVVMTTATMPELPMLGDTITVTLTGENVKLTEVVFTDYTPGTVNNPMYIMEEKSTMTVPVGTTYYAAFFHGTTMNVTADGTYKVVVEGTEYTPVEGVVTVELPAAAGMGRPMPLNIQIVNEGTAALSAEVEFVYPEGTMSNPKDIEAGTYDATFEAGAMAEYYYNWTAPAAGTVTIGVTSEGGWQYAVDNATTYVYGDYHWSDEDPVVSSEVLTVAEGDVIEIRVITYDPANPWATPAGTITTTVAFEADEQELPPESESETETETETESESESESESNTEGDEENIPSKGDLVGTMGIMVVLMGAALVLVAIVSRKKAA